MTDQELIIWCAGFFDGEGCVSIAKNVRKSSRANGQPSISYTLGVSICQKDRGPLDVIQRLFGGSLYPYDVRGVTYHRWHTWSATALHVLETLMPYLILKKERASTSVNFQKSLTAWNLDYGRRGYPDFVNVAREQFFQTMKGLNQRGVSTDNPTPKRPGVKKGSGNYFTNRGRVSAINSSKETQLVQ